MSALCSGLALIEGMRSKPKSSSMKRSLLASMYCLIVSIVLLLLSYSVAARAQLAVTLRGKYRKIKGEKALAASVVKIVGWRFSLRNVRGAHAYRERRAQLSSCLTCGARTVLGKMSQKSEGDAV